MLTGEPRSRDVIMYLGSRTTLPLAMHYGRVGTKYHQLAHAWQNYRLPHLLSDLPLAG
jgi:hypothetical protein